MYCLTGADHFIRWQKHLQFKCVFVCHNVLKMISQTYWPDYVKGLPQLALNRDLNPINYNFFGKIATNRDVAQKVGSRFIFFIPVTTWCVTKAFLMRGTETNEVALQLVLQQCCLLYRNVTWISLFLGKLIVIFNASIAHFNIVIWSNAHTQNWDLRRTYKSCLLTVSTDTIYSQIVTPVI